MRVERAASVFLKKEIPIKRFLSIPLIPHKKVGAEGEEDAKKYRDDQEIYDRAVKHGFCILGGAGIMASAL